MMGAASRSMKKIIYVRVNRAIQGKTVTVSTAKAIMNLKIKRKPLHKPFVTYRMWLNASYTRKVTFYTLNAHQKSYEPDTNKHHFSFNRTRTLQEKHDLTVTKHFT